MLGDKFINFLCLLSCLIGLLALVLFVHDVASKQGIDQSSSSGIEVTEDPFPNQLPKADEKGYTLKTNQTVYGYNSLPSQTDDTPYITASGFDLSASGRHLVVANNCLPFGERVVIRGVIYIVEDRMNSRYGCDVWDIWFPTYEEAREWGKRREIIKIYK